MEMLTQRTTYVGTLLFSPTVETYEIAKLRLLYFDFRLGCLPGQSEVPLERFKGSFDLVNSKISGILRKELIILRRH